MMNSQADIVLSHRHPLADGPGRAVTLLTKVAVVAGPILAGASTRTLLLTTPVLLLGATLAGLARPERRQDYRRALNAVQTAAPASQCVVFLGLTVGLLPNVLLHSAIRPRFYRTARELLRHPYALLMLYAAGMSLPVIAILMDCWSVSECSRVLVGITAVVMAVTLGFALIYNQRLMKFLNERLENMVQLATHGDLGAPLRNHTAGAALGVLENLSSLDPSAFELISDGLVMLFFAASILVLPAMALLGGQLIDFLTMALLPL